MTLDLVIAKTIKEGKHALIDWDLEDGEYSQVMIITNYEILEGLDPSEWRLHFASNPSRELFKAIDATCKSRKVLMQNITVRKYGSIDDGFQTRK